MLRGFKNFPDKGRPEHHSIDFPTESVDEKGIYRSSEVGKM